MEEKLVNFKTAELAKKKGFNIPTWDYFCPQGEQYNPLRQDWNSLSEPYPHTSRPSQSLLAKWLREVHHISVKVDDFYSNGKIKFDYNVSKLGSQEDNPRGMFNSFESSFETGLYKALSTIIKKS